MKDLLDEIQLSQNSLNQRLLQLLDTGLTKEQYRNYLSMQYHLTNGVQKHFLAVCAHETLRGKTALRKFLFKFSLEEEPHFQVAYNDILNLGMTPTECPLDVELWKLYFENLLKSKPFARIGAACILENVTAKSGALIDQLFSKADYISKKNTTFVTIHRHEELPHGDEVMSILEESHMTAEQKSDLLLGAKNGNTIFFRCFDWAINHK